MNTKLLVVVLVLATALIVGSRLVPQFTDAEPANVSNEPEEIRPESLIADNKPASASRKPSESRSLEPLSTFEDGTEDERECDIGLSDESEHPVMAAEFTRLSPLMTDIPELDAYRAQSRESLETLAESGDSLAMYVLGMSYLRDVEHSNYNDAVDFIRSTDAFSVYSGELDAKQIDSLDKGSRWLYEAALHGRYAALGDLTRLESKRYGGPIDQGLIAADPELTESERTLLDMNLAAYIDRKILFQSHPAFSSGYMRVVSATIDALEGGQLISPEMAANPALNAIIDEKLSTFNRDRENAGLPIPQIPPPAMSNAEMFRAICGDDVEIPVAWQ